ncbi:MAG TPA: class I adenylate-forming enzyme family protein, partial [Miltoncostaeales bacterium]|nr:class I adenylate-forming enzyme family protein [Miltoncostaeales bacterium]
ACKGPGITPGYYGNDEANAKLFRDDGWMYLGDIVQIDDDGYLSVVGRTADFIIRGGHNVSAPAVEEELLAHPQVAMAAVVGMPATSMLSLTATSRPASGPVAPVAWSAISSGTARVIQIRWSAASVRRCASATASWMSGGSTGVVTAPPR